MQGPAQVTKESEVSEVPILHPVHLPGYIVDSDLNSLQGLLILSLIFARFTDHLNSPQLLVRSRPRQAGAVKEMRSRTLQACTIAIVIVIEIVHVIVVVIVKLSG